MANPYGQQSVSLTQAGGDLDLLEALRGGRRAKTQQEMLREQSLAPVEIGSYNGIQGNFPISQGFNKIAQGLLATYMDSQARDKAQAAADEKTASDRAGVNALIDALKGTPADDPLPEGMQGPVRPAQAPLTGDPRQMALITAMAGTSPSAAHTAELVSKQDAAALARQDTLDARAFQAGQQRELIKANRDRTSAENQPARDEAQRLIAQDLQHRQEAKEFVTKYNAAPLEEQRKMLTEAQFSGNKYLTGGATHIGDLISKAEIAKTTADKKAQDVPPPVNRQYTQQLDIHKTTERTVNEIDKNIARINSGVLKFDPLNNASDTLRSFTGANTEQSRAKVEYRNDVLRLANDVTLAAKGTQTEFDARRAYDLIAGNLNDRDIVRTQLEKLRRIAVDSQNTAAKSLNILGKAYSGLGHDPVGMAEHLKGPAPKPDPAPGAPGASAPRVIQYDATGKRVAQ